MPDLYCDRIDTPKGVFLVLFHTGGIYRVFFPGQGPRETYPVRRLPWVGLSEDLNRYLSGEEVDWTDYPMDTTGYAPFTAKLLEKIRHIPHGQVCTYRQAAERAGSPRACRAAGQALKANRHPVLVPCHRVVASGGKLGGFSGPPGWKQMLLEIEAGPYGED